MPKPKSKIKGLDTAFFYFIVIAGALIGAVIFIANADTKPATPEDYAPLYRQVESLRSDYTFIGEFDNIKTLTDKKVVLNGGKQCDLAIIFDEEKSIKDVQEIDKALNPVQYVITLLFSAAAGAGVGFLCATVVFVIIICIEKKKKEE